MLVSDIQSSLSVSVSAGQAPAEARGTPRGSRNVQCS